MIARPEWGLDDEPVIINKLTGEPAKVDETCQWTPPPVPERRRGGGIWYFLSIALMGVGGAAATSAMGWHPMVGATAIWLVVAIAAVFYHHWVLRQVKGVKKELADSAEAEVQQELCDPVARGWKQNGRH